MAKFFTNINPGVMMITHPYQFVPVGNELEKHVRVTCGKKAPPNFVTRKVEGMQFERAFIENASFIRLKPKPPEEGAENTDRSMRDQKDRIVLVSERDNDKENAIVLAHLPSGYKGDSVISVHDKASIIADCFVPHGMTQEMGASHYVLAYLAPGGELRGRISGRKIKAPCARWVYDGKEVLYFEGGEDIFFNANEHMAQLDDLPQP